MLGFIDNVIFACHLERIAPLSAQVISERVVAALGNPRATAETRQMQIEFCRDLAQLKLAADFDPGVNKSAFAYDEVTFNLWPRTQDMFPEYVGLNDLSASEARALYDALRRRVGWCEELADEIKRKFPTEIARSYQ
ncbi:hypothetical protein LA76x_4934 [Lysobacter antibioticus]|uniref:Uncharacterized protein n=1 Tax=Lysobacter antibioticus TaxID=84531 RepID=A0A0S2FHL3_LYSAN|nr:hypothetical protein LA76x_4934 [Lysobacter antibioticus]